MGERDRSPSDRDDDGEARREESRADATGGDASESQADDWEWETETTTASSDPLGDLARDVRARNRSSSDAEDLFESVDVDEMDSETVWSSIEETNQGTDPGVGASQPDEERVAASSLDDWGDAAGPEQVVPRADYCARCEYLADPPTLACTHDGTDIVEVVDHEHFLVRACPFVEEQPVGPADDDPM